MKFLKPQLSNSFSSSFKKVFEVLLNFLKAPLPLRTRQLDKRFKYQYSYDRFKTGKSGRSPKQEQVGLAGMVTKLQSDKGRQKVDEREALFGDHILLSSTRRFTEEDARVFFKLGPHHDQQQLKKAYRFYVLSNHPDLHANSAQLDPKGYALAQKKVQLANLFKDMLSQAG
jgi:hypothetical protein